jgi:hypothetical protein
MKADDRKPFLEVVMGFTELRGKTLSAPALELYWNAMQDWDLADFRAAANHLLRTCEWMPLPHHFEALRKAGRDTAGEAWIEAQKHLVWGLESYTLSHDCPPLIARAVRAIGGAHVIAMTPQDKLPFLERRFTEHFEAMQDSEDTREAVPQIAYHDTIDAPRIAGAFKRIGGSA